MIIEKLKKIKALAESGIDGEKDAARRLLSELCSKYNISESELSDDKVLPKGYNTSKYKQDIFIFTHVVKTINPELKIWSSQRRGWSVVDATEIMHIEIGEQYEFHRKQFAKELEKLREGLFQAYFSKHNLFYKRDDDNKAAPATGSDLNLILGIRKSLEDVAFRKAIQN